VPDLETLIAKMLDAGGVDIRDMASLPPEVKEKFLAMRLVEMRDANTSENAAHASELADIARGMAYVQRTKDRLKAALVACAELEDALQLPVAERTVGHMIHEIVLTLKIKMLTDLAKS